MIARPVDDDHRLPVEAVTFRDFADDRLGARTLVVWHCGPPLRSTRGFMGTTDNMSGLQPDRLVVVAIMLQL